MKKNIRVVDYKSGNKKFKLSDVLYGLNLQMFVYLFTICSDKKSKFCGIPAGVLYMHASKSVASLDSQNTEEALRKNADSEYKMKGVVLYDDEHDILNDMEEGVEGRFIPVSYDSKGNVKGCFASLEGLADEEEEDEEEIEELEREERAEKEIEKAKVENKRKNRPGRA